MQMPLEIEREKWIPGQISLAFCPSKSHWISWGNVKLDLILIGEWLAKCLLKYQGEFGFQRRFHWLSAQQNPMEKWPKSLIFHGVFWPAIGNLPKVWPQVKPTNWPQILERFVEKEKNVAQIKNLDGVRDCIHFSLILTIWSEGYHWNQLDELIFLIPNSIFHVKVSCQSIRLIRYGINDTLTRCKSIIHKNVHRKKISLAWKF